MLLSVDNDDDDDDHGGGADGDGDDDDDDDNDFFLPKARRTATPSVKFVCLLPGAKLRAATCSASGTWIYWRSGSDVCDVS